MSYDQERCPRCAELDHIAHVWRTDMEQLVWIDEWKCLRCGERWAQHSTPRKQPL